MNGRKIESALYELLNGVPIIFGTDTVNGIGCLYDDLDTIEKIFTLKKREKDKPMILLCSDYDMVKRYFVLSEYEQRIMKEYMPGKLTIIAESKRQMNKYTEKNGKTGFRIPGRESLMELIKKLDKPLASTSINQSGKDVILSRNEMKNKYSGLFIFNNLSMKKVSSTIIEIDGNKIKYIRNGAVKIRRFNGKNKSV